MNFKKVLSLSIRYSNYISTILFNGLLLTANSYFSPLFMKLYSHISRLLHISTEEDRNRLYKVLLPTFMVQVGGMGISTLVSLIMGRSMGPTNYGIYIYCFSIVMGVVNFMVYGLNLLSLRETSGLLATGKVGLWKGFMGWNSATLFILSFGGATIAIAVVYFFPVLPNSAYRLPMLIMCSAIPLYSFLLLLSSVLRGMHKVLLSQVSEKIVRPATMLLLLAVLYFFERHITLYPALIINSLACAAGLVFVIIKYRSHAQSIIKDEKAEYERRRWVREVSGLFLFGALVSIDSQIDVYMLGFLKPPAEVGVYKIAANVALITSFILTISNIVLAPSFARLHTLQEREQLQRLITQTIRWVMLLTAPIAIVVMVFSRRILSLWGPGFERGQIALIILCAANLINSAFGSVGNLALMSKYEKYNGMVIIMSIAINIALNFVLTPRWGLNGTAFASGFSIVVWNVSLFFIIKRKTGIKAWVFSTGKK